MIVNFFEMLTKEGSMVRNCCYIIAAAILLGSLLFVHNEHPHTWMEAHIPGFWTLFTIVSCLVLVFFARIYGACGIKKEENYYDK